MQESSIIKLAAEAGKIILENGGETYRVEETINRICYSYEVEFVESFVTPTGIMLSTFTSSGENISIIRRVKKRSVDLEKIYRVNELSRNIAINKLLPEEFEDQLNEINSNLRYSFLTTLIYSGIASGAFTLLFNGEPRDAFIAFIIGVVIKLMTSFFSSYKLNPFFINIIGGAITSILALSSTHIGIGEDADIIIIGSIMLLVPGIAITNAIRDTIAGDLLSGVSRGVEAILVAIAIAIGSGVVISLWQNIWGGVL